MSNVWILGIILMIWATVGMIGLIFHGRFKVNWCLIFFYAFIPFVALLANWLKVF